MSLASLHFSKFFHFLGISAPDPYLESLDSFSIRRPQTIARVYTSVNVNGISTFITTPSAQRQLGLPKPTSGSVCESHYHFFRRFRVPKIPLFSEIIRKFRAIAVKLGIFWKFCENPRNFNANLRKYR